MFHDDTAVTVFRARRYA